MGLNMSEQDKEAAAISTIINALVGLDEISCIRVLEYASKRFAPSTTLPIPIVRIADEIQTGSTAELPSAQDDSKQTDIKSLKDEKLPANSIQMAVLVAYYLKELSPTGQRKESIGTADVVKYFNQARFPLPTGKNGPGDTLNNARRSGYLETAGTGQFRLTPVGHNLAAYKMPTKKPSR